MPLRMSEADAIHSAATTIGIGLLYPGEVFKTKNSLISRSMTYHDVVKRRYVMVKSRALVVKHECPFPNCKFVLMATFKSMPRGSFSPLRQLILL